MSIIRKIPWTTQPSDNVGINRSLSLTNGLTNYFLASSNKYGDRSSARTNQVGKVPSPIGLIETDQSASVWGDNGKAVADTEGTVLWFGMLDITGGDSGLITNRADTSTNWNALLFLRSTGKIDFISWDGTATEASTAPMITSTRQRVIAIGSGRHGGKTKVYIKHDSDIITGVNNSCNWGASTKSMAINGYYDFSAARTINGNADDGGCALGVAWNRQLSDAEAFALLDNPWQIFQPRTQIIPTFAAAAGTPPKYYRKHVGFACG